MNAVYLPTRMRGCAITHLVWRGTVITLAACLAGHRGSAFPSTNCRMTWLPITLQQVLTGKRLWQRQWLNLLIGSSSVSSL